MKRKLRGWSIVTIGTLALGVPGCLWFGNESENEGRICASPMEGGDHCVPASYGAMAAWNDAASAGSEPIQMWVEWPENVGVTQLVINPKLLNAWLDDVQTVLDYLRLTRGYAESYHASLSGRLGQQIRDVRQFQEMNLDAKSANPKVRVKKALLDKAANETDALKVEVTADKQSVGDVLAIVDQKKVDGA